MRKSPFERLDLLQHACELVVEVQQIGQPRIELRAGKGRLVCLQALKDLVLTEFGILRSRDERLDSQLLHNSSLISLLIEVQNACHAYRQAVAAWSAAGRAFFRRVLYIVDDFSD